MKTGVPETYLRDNSLLFFDTLPGRQAPLGSPGGAAHLSPLGVDTELVASHPQAEPHAQATCLLSQRLRREHLEHA
ncbi:hypothetical protein GCM10022261_15270 [Brevibacterium daeguense]|uniref:Uncharacterized protein n=1 Tax=Brevibacterium daeguense TaxID=909936 RepID=A0ABP8EJB4_9MICO|nr:hypothetical protein [Brevibacterium daeguense]